MALGGLLKGGLHTRASDFRDGGAEDRRRGGEKRTLPRGREGPGASASRSRGPLWSHPVSTSYSYWEINTPWGVLFQTSQKTQRGGAAVAWATVQTPSLSGTQDGRISLRTLVPFDFKGKPEKGNSKSISPKRVRFPLDKEEHRR